MIFLIFQLYSSDDKIYTSTGNFEKVADQDFVEHVLTFSDGIKLEDAGKYTCRLSHLESDAELNLVVETGELDCLSFSFDRKQLLVIFEIANRFFVMELNLISDGFGGCLLGFYTKTVFRYHEF